MLMHDVRYAIRFLFKNSASSLFMALVLSVGIGVNTAIFSMVDAIVLHPLPFPHIDRLVTLSEVLAKAKGQGHGVSTANFLDWQKENFSFQHVAAYKTSVSVVTGHESRERVETCLVSPEFFQILGLSPRLGRYYSEQEDEKERNTAVLSFRFWQQRLNSDPFIIGKKINLDGLDYDVIGVAPHTLDFPLYTQIWLPLTFSPADKTDRARRDLSVIARLKDGYTIGNSRNDMARVSLNLAERYPLTNAGTSVTVLSLLNSVNSFASRFLVILMTAVGFVLLLACANVANLQLARVMWRRKEIALRYSLGARRSLIVRQLMVESMLLSLFGIIPGLLIATLMLEYVKRNMTQTVVRNVAGFANVAIDGRVLVFTLAASVVSAVLLVLPALYQVSREHIVEVLKEEGRGGAGNKEGSRIRSALVISEVMLAIILLVGANLMITAFNHVTSAYRGYDPVGISIFNLNLPPSQYSNEAKVKDVYKKVLWQVGTLNGVRSEGMVSVLPSVGDSESSQIITEETNARSASANPAVEVRVISEDYFKTMSIPVKSGRAFINSDTSDRRMVAILSENAARAFWPGGSPLGHQIKLASGGFDTSWLNVVGVVGDVNYFFLNDEVRPTVYLPYQQTAVHPMSIIVRTNPNLSGLSSEIRNAVQQVDATQEIYRIRSMQTVLNDMAGGIRIVASLMMTLGLLALALCASGVYAIMSYSVAQQTKEIGIRMALGAQRRHVLNMIFTRALKLVAVGLIFGVPIAIALGYFLSHLLKGVVVIPWLSFAWLAILIAAVATLASYLPARRAIHVAPLDALRG